MSYYSMQPIINSFKPLKMRGKSIIVTLITLAGIGIPARTLNTLGSIMVVLGGVAFTWYL